MGFDGLTGDAGVAPLPGTLTFSDELRSALEAPAFMDAALPAGAVDTTRLARAQAFDHWELTGPGSAWTPSSRWTVADAPMPRFPRLLLAAKAHLAVGARAGTLPQAASDVRQLARLCLSTESLIGAMTGVALAGLEGRAHAWALAHAVEVGEWRPVDAARLRRAKAVLLLSSSFLSPSADDATLARALTCAQVSRCVGLTETASFTAGLSPQLPEPQAARMRAVFAATARPDARCAFASARYFASRPLGFPTTPGWIPGEDVGSLLLLLASREVEPLAVLTDAGVPVVPVVPASP